MPLVLTCRPTGPRFFISADATMPEIVMTATLSGVPLNPAGPVPTYEWSATLVFDGGVPPTNTAYGGNRRTQHAPIRSQAGHGNTWRIPFTEVRGGLLTVNVIARVGGTVLNASSTNLTIAGTNPLPTAIRAFANSIGATKVRFRKQLRQESSLQQFRPPGNWPKYSSDGLGGVGLAQITRPAPTADQTWNWKENIRAGWALYQEKERIARAYPANAQRSESFRNLVGAWNRARSAQNLSQAQVTLPAFTDEQLELDTIRGFNGYANGLHEFRPRTQSGQLVVTLDSSGQRGSAEWERVPVDERGNAGDPRYVEHVDAAADF